MQMEIRTAQQRAENSPMMSMDARCDSRAPVLTPLSSAAGSRPENRVAMRLILKPK